MALTEAIAAAEHLLTAQVSVNGVLIQPADPTSSSGVPGWGSLQLSKSLEAPVPVCSIEVNRIPEWIERGQAVEVNLGYDGYTRRVFTGYVQDRSRGVNSATLHCMGNLYQAFRTYEIPERDVDGDTVATAIGDILDYVGITDRNIDVPAFTLGTASSPKLERAAASSMLQTLMDIDGCYIWETATGQVIVRDIVDLPAVTSFKTYTSTANATARILEGSDREDPDYTRTRVIVTGATVVEGTAPDETSRTITATATLVGDLGFIKPALPDGSYSDMEFSNHLIDTDAKAAEVASRLLTKYGRVPRYLTLEIAGDPQLELCQTLTLTMPEVDVTGNWFISGMEHIIDDSGYVTRLQLRGGDEYGGQVNLNPVASFTYVVDREVIGDAVYVFATFDASASYDPDGSIASYAWSDNQSTTPEIATLTDAVVTVRADPSAWTGTWDVTLTVTDDAALTATLTLSIPYAAGESLITIPAIFAAINNNASATPDGGENWTSQAGSTCVSVGAKMPDGINSGIACYGYTDGSIKRTTDFCVSALTTVLAAAGANGTIKDIKWDVNNPSRVWAVTSTGRVLRSNDDGVTWTVYKDFGNTYALNRLSTPAAGGQSVGGLWVFGGRGDVTTTLIQYDATLSNNWVSVAIGGQLTTDLVGATSAATIADAVSTKWGELAIIFKGEALANDVAIFYTAAVFGDGSGWTRATGLDAALVEGRYIVGEFLPTYLYAAFNNRDVWASTDGVAWTKTANVLPANCVPHYAYYIGWAIYDLNCHLICVENTSDTSSGIYKTADGFATAQVVWPATGFTAWPASAIGKMVAIGAARFPTGSLLIGGLLITPTERMAAWQSGGTFTKHVFPANLDADSFFFWRVINSLVWFGFWGPTDSVDNQDDFHTVRTVDGGTTWDDLYTEAAVGYVWQDIQKAADGRLWGVTLEAADRKHMRIYYNDDPEGDGSWTQSKDDAGSVSAERIMHVVPHPSDANIIAVMGKSGGTSQNCITWITTNRGTTWTQNVLIGLFVSGGSFKTFDRMMLANGRIVMVGNDASGNAVIWTSDDYGVSWTERLEVAKVGATIDYGYGPVGNPVTGLLFYMWEDSDASPAEIRIYRSVNGGQVWTAIASSALGNMPPQPATTDIYKGGIAYDSNADTLYLFGAGESNANNISQVVRARTVSTGNIGTWEDVSDALNPIDGTHTLYKVDYRTTHGIVVIPS